MGSPAVAAAVDGLNHSIDNLLDPDIAERFTVNEPPEGA
jgi:hypothetical protein